MNVVHTMMACQVNALTACAAGWRHAVQREAAVVGELIRFVWVVVMGVDSTPPLGFGPLEGVGLCRK